MLIFRGQFQSHADAVLVLLDCLKGLGKALGLDLGEHLPEQPMGATSL